MTGAIAIIPARLGSTRLPGKVLLAETGWPLIRHVHERARAARSIERVVIATDHPRVADAVRGFGGEVVMTAESHPNGTSRLAEAASLLRLTDSQVVVNVQGDEPELAPAVIDAVVESLRQTGGAKMSTAAVPIAGEADATNPNIVKVVIGRDGRALYFSRARIPFDRDADGDADARCLRHLGIYGYTAGFLRTYAALDSTPLERCEKLEQLRALEHGHGIAVAVVNDTGGAGGPGIDTPEQYAAFVQRWRSQA